MPGIRGIFRRLTIGRARQRLVHLTINNNRGSVEHFYHFMLGFLAPLGRYYAGRKPQAKGFVVVRSCGPMDRILREVHFPGLLIADKRDHQAMLGATAGIKDVFPISLEGFDLGRNAPDYPEEAIRTGMGYVRDRLFAELEEAAAERTDPPRQPNLLLIERGRTDPFYLSARSESKGGGAERRAIANHAELAALIEQHFGACTNIRLESATLAEQIALFGAADVVVAQHGAALSNIVWMRPGTHVIELITAERSEKTDVFGKLASAFGVQRSCVLQDGKFGKVDPDQLLSVLSSVVSA